MLVRFLIAGSSEYRRQVRPGMFGAHEIDVTFGRASRPIAKTAFVACQLQKIVAVNREFGCWQWSSETADFEPSSARSSIWVPICQIILKALSGPSSAGGGAGLPAASVGRQPSDRCAAVATLMCAANRRPSSEAKTVRLATRLQCFIAISPVHQHPSGKVASLH